MASAARQHQESDCLYVLVYILYVMRVPLWFLRRIRVSTGVRFVYVVRMVFMAASRQIYCVFIGRQRGLVSGARSHRSWQRARELCVWKEKYKFITMNKKKRLERVARGYSIFVLRPDLRVFFPGFVSAMNTENQTRWKRE